jgi:hypothetical protein
MYTCAGHTYYNDGYAGNAQRCNAIGEKEIEKER